jgi:hypothetical protein
MPLSRTYDLFFVEGSPTELAPGFQLIKRNPSLLSCFLRERTLFTVAGLRR